MAPNRERAAHTTALAWGLVTLADIGGVLVAALTIDPTLGATGYGPIVPVGVLATASGATLGGMLIAVGAWHTARPLRVLWTIVVTTAAGAVLVLAVINLTNLTNGGGYGTLLASAVVGMEYLAVSIIRVTS